MRVGRFLADTLRTHVSEDLGRCGVYRLLARIGAGGMGEIFLAEGPGGDRVAIKRLLAECARDPVFVGMFLDEARLASRLEHPNVCRVHDLGREGDRYYLVMEHIDGLSLKELLERRGYRGLPFPLAARLIAEVASGLDYAHRLRGDDGQPLGIVHRDISPANILVGRDGQVKLVDFGLAKARTQLVKTQPGLVKGKFGYLAPEQLAGRVDWRTDLFAMGLCLYEALTGQQLFDQRTAAETVTAIRTFGGPPRLEGTDPSIPAGLDEVLRASLSVDPRGRHESASAFRAALGEVVVRSGTGSVSQASLAELVQQTHDPLDGPPRPEAPTTLRPPALASSPPGPARSSPPWPLLALGAALALGLLVVAVLLAT